MCSARGHCKFGTKSYAQSTLTKQLSSKLSYVVRAFVSVFGIKSHARSALGNKIVIAPHFQELSWKLINVPLSVGF